MGSAPPTWAQYWDAETAWMSLKMGCDGEPAGETARIKAVNFSEGLEPEKRWGRG